MKRILRYFFIISSINLTLIAIAGLVTVAAKKQEKSLEISANKASVISAKQIQKKVLKAMGLKNIKNIYNMKYQNETAKQIEQLKASKKYTLEQPLFIWNPFGTNTTGLYVYFESEDKVSVGYTISADDPDISDFSAELCTNQAGTPLRKQEGQIIGFIPGITNYLTLRLYNEKNKLINTVIYQIDVPDNKTIKEKKLDYEINGSSNQLSDGFFVLFGYDRRNYEEPRHLLFYDNEGNIRAEIPLNVIIQDVNIAFIEENIFYACSTNRYALVNRLGKVERIYTIGDYTSHHDFVYDEKEKRILLLADERSKGTKEDVVLSLDLYTGEAEKLLDFEELLPDIRSRAKIPKEAQDQKLLDWIHLNSIQVIDGQDVIVSSRELSTIFRVNNINTNPKIEYLIGDQSIWKGTKYEKLLLEKRGDFVSQTGQHSVFYEETAGLSTGQYYLTFFNNNYGDWSTYPDYDWGQIKGIGLPEQPAEYSYLYQYLVDEKKSTYQLKKSIEVPYSSVVSNIQQHEDNIITCSGEAKVFEEYTSNGKRIARYFMDVDLFTYRVFKYTMKGFWFNP